MKTIERLTTPLSIRFAAVCSVVSCFMTVPVVPAQDPEARGSYEQALTFYRAERFEEAAGILEAAISGGVEDPLGYRILLGWCRLRQDRTGEALEEFTVALELAPGNTEALEGAARSAARLGRDEEALTFLLELSAAAPGKEIDPVANGILARGGSDRRIRTIAREGKPAIVARAGKAYLEADRGMGRWEPIFVKGVNLGAALPGKYPSQFPEDKETYARWLSLMADMGANVVRLYTLHPPHFYEALREHNDGRGADDGFLWLVQGVWTELPENDAYDHPDFTGQFVGEIERVIDALHGNIAVARRPGHAFGLYDTDVSPMTLALILGREWEPYSVSAFDEKRPRPASFDGRHFVVSNGTPTEAWMARVMDHAVSYETSSYGAQRPVSFTSWPTLDPLHHPTEATRDEEIALLTKLGIPQEPGTIIEYNNDSVSIDANRIVPTRLTPAGTFASYHTYPYYPEFMNVDPGYAKAGDRHGPSSYIGYLRELKAHHSGMPLLIAEFGVPTSRGISHHQPQGWHHGGHTEKQQGAIDLRMFENILDSGCAGGILFAWIDEWFKKNWLVMDFEVPSENNANWLNILDPEQNYGLVAAKPGAAGWRIVIDGEGDDWAGVDPLGGGGHIEALRVTHDEAYIYIRLDVAHLDWEAARYAIGIDTHGAAEGDHLFPIGRGPSTETGMEFLLDLSGPATSRLMADVPYDLHVNRFSRPWRSVENHDGVFTEMLAETNRRKIGRDGTVFPAISYSRSPLRHGTMDPDSPDADDLADWADNEEEGFLEIRVGWNLLNVTDPSTRQVLRDSDPPRGGTGHVTTAGFRFYVVAQDPRDGKVVSTLPAAGPEEFLPAHTAPFYTWEPWDSPSYHTYLKKSYTILKEHLGELEPPAVGASR